MAVRGLPDVHGKKNFPALFSITGVQQKLTKVPEQKFPTNFDFFRIFLLP